jgi:hypothetical protein
MVLRSCTSTEVTQVGTRHLMSACTLSVYLPPHVPTLQGIHTPTPLHAHAFHTFAHLGSTLHGVACLSTYTPSTWRLVQAGLESLACVLTFRNHTPAVDLECSFV